MAQEKVQKREKEETWFLTLDAYLKNLHKRLDRRGCSSSLLSMET